MPVFSVWFSWQNHLKKLMAKRTIIHFLKKVNAVTWLTPALADREIFSSVEQVVADLQRCMFWCRLLSERQRLSCFTVVWTQLTIWTVRNNLKRKYCSKEPYDVQNIRSTSLVITSPKQHGVANDSVWRELYVTVAMTIKRWATRFKRWFDWL